MLFLLPDMQDTRWVCEGEKEMRKQETVASSAHKRGPVVVVVANRLFLCSVGCWLSRCHSALTSSNVLSISLTFFFLSPSSASNSVGLVQVQDLLQCRSLLHVHVLGRISHVLEKLYRDYQYVFVFLTTFNQYPKYNLQHNSVCVSPTKP